MNTNVTDIRKEIEDIIKERASQTVKREKLLSIGLTNSDIQQLFFAQRLAKKIQRKARLAEQTETQTEQIVEDILTQIFDRYTFGVEIECFNVRLDNVGIIASNHGLDFRHESYNHIDNNTYYKLVADSSICGENDDRGIECVSPILNGANGGFDSLKACCDTLNEACAKVNRTTGLHVHVGGDISERQYCNVFVNYYFLEGVIDSFMAPSRRHNRFAKSLNDNIEIDRLMRCVNHDNVCACLHNDRYYKVNCMSWSRHHTIEFRQHQGTTDYEKISMWARFCVRLVHWSDNNILQATVTSIDDIEFLTDEEKTFFKNRAAAFASQQQ